MRPSFEFDYQRTEIFCTIVGNQKGALENIITIVNYNINDQKENEG